MRQEHTLFMVTKMVFTAQQQKDEHVEETQLS